MYEYRVVGVSRTESEAAIGNWTVDERIQGGGSK